MDRSYTDQTNPLMPPITEDNNSNRSKRSLSPGLGPVFAIFIIGLGSGATGGLLLGATVVIVLQSLELLADNKLLIDQLEIYVMDNDAMSKIYKQVDGIEISAFAMTFSVISSSLSVAVGVYTGFSTYSLELKRKGEEARGKALAVAGTACLSGVTVTGCIMGFAFESVSSITFHKALLLYVILYYGSFFFVIIAPFLSFSFVIRWVCCLTPTLIVAYIGAAFATSYLVRMKVTLAILLIPEILTVKLLKKSHTPKLHTLTVRLMLIISDVYNTAGQQIVALQSPTSTNTQSAVVEAIFVGVLASLMWTVTEGMFLFVSWQRGGAGKTCAAATAAGSAVLGSIKLFLPVLGPGPTIGALIGVAGAAGVSLSAAVAVTDQYQPGADQHGLVGRVGVTLGAAVGAFLMSGTHSGLAGMFMALCAAAAPPGAFLMMFLHSTSLRPKERLFLHLLPEAVTIFTYASLFYMMPSSAHEVISFLFFMLYLGFVFFGDDFGEFE